MDYKNPGGRAKIKGNFRSRKSEGLFLKKNHFAFCITVITYYILGKLYESLAFNDLVKTGRDTLDK